MDSPIEGCYVVEPVPNKKALVSHIYGQGSHVTLEVINDSNSYITFRKGKPIGHAESAALVIDEIHNCNILKTNFQLIQESEDHKDSGINELPDHLKNMYENNIPELSTDEKLKFKNLLSEF